MSVTYFRSRDRFDFSKETLDIGNSVQWNRSHFLKHFFKRVFAIPADRVEEFTSATWLIIYRITPTVQKKYFLNIFGHLSKDS